ncbi:MAG: 30S ribosomal protein S12 methylthiotransferase RimO, partial [Bacteroidota bacterium]
MKKPKVNIITLGCAKNLVDSEYLSCQLTLNGYQVSFQDSVASDITIINTCGFINDAKQESIETILEYADKKKNSKLSA